VYLERGPAAVIAPAVTLSGCGGLASGGISSSSGPVVSLTAADVTAVVQAAAQAVDLNTMVIAVVHRAGRILVVSRKTSAPAAISADQIIVQGRLPYLKFPRNPAK
jgi:hypothetical protein